MSKKIKILIVVGTRPELIRLSRIITELNKLFDVFLLHTNQNYNTNLKDVFFKDLNIKPNKILKENKNNSIAKISQVLTDVDETIKVFKPDAFLILGDTNSALSAISAKKNKIPIFHIEAGNRCFNQLVPEEINRKIIDHISDINLTYSDFARNNLLKEGIPSDQVFKIGSPLCEVINFHTKNLDIKFFLKKNNLRNKKFILVSFHREENIEDTNKLKNFIEILIELEKKYKFPILVSTHPRLKENLKKMNYQINKNIIFSKPFGFKEYLSLQLSAKIVISDSGSITEEASILNIPAISLREDIERQEGMDEGAIILSEINKTSLINSLDILLNTQSKKFPSKIEDYNVENVSSKVSRIIQSYVSFINRRVWKKRKD